MATKTLTTRIIIRNDTAENWTASNPTLLKGEIGLEMDTGKYKIGDGTSNWQALPYYVHYDGEQGGGGTITDVKVNNDTVVQDGVANITIGVLTTSETTQSEVSAGESFTGNIVLHKVAKTGNYNDLLNKLNVVDNLDSTSATDALSANQGNTLKSMVQALPSAKSFTNIQAMITALNGYGNTEMNVGTSIYLQQTDVPDFWVYSKEETNTPYTYTDDNTFINAVETSGHVQVGYYNVAELETAKVDLTDYVDLTSEQTITGTKTFNNIILNSTGISNTALSTNGTYFGKGITTVDDNCCAIGNSSQATVNSSAIGNSTIATGFAAVALGNNAVALQSRCVQIGAGTNDTADSVQFFEYQIFNRNTGKILNERLNDTVVISTDTLILDGGNSTIATE